MKRVFFCCFLSLTGFTQEAPTSPPSLVVTLAQVPEGTSEEYTEQRTSPTSIAEVEAVVAPLLSEYYPDAEVVDSSSVHYRVKFDTMQFHVHGRDKIGRYAGESHEIEGPNNLGFILDVRRRDTAYIGAAVMPQTFQNPYWETHGNELQPEGNGLSVRFSCGSKVKREFYTAILDLLGQRAQ